MKKILAMVFVGVFLLSGIAYAVPVQWESDVGGNNHYYELIETTMTWSDALLYSESLGGYLATITSEAENNFITTYLLPTTLPWDGIFLGGTDKNIEGVWEWANGEAWGYTNWHYGEPNNYLVENYLVINTNPNKFGKWNDWVDQEARFIIEYENNPVPEPTTIFLLGTGIVGLAGARRKMRKS